MTLNFLVLVFLFKMHIRIKENIITYKVLIASLSTFFSEFLVNKSSCDLVTFCTRFWLCLLFQTQCFAHFCLLFDIQTTFKFQIRRIGSSQEICLSNLSSNEIQLPEPSYETCLTDRNSNDI